MSVDWVGLALGGTRLRLAGNPSRTAANIIRHSDRMCHGVVITSMPARLKPRSSKAAFSEWKGNFLVCFSRLNRSSSKTKVGTPSSSSAKPESWVSRYESEDAHEVPTRDLEVGSVRGNWAGREDCRGLALSQGRA